MLRPAPSEPLVLSIQQPERRRSRSSASRLSKRRRRPMRRPRRRSDWRRRPLPKLRLRPRPRLKLRLKLKLLRPRRMPLLLRLRRLLRQHRSLLSPRLRTPTVNKRSLSETASPGKPPSQRQTKLQAGAPPVTTREDPVEAPDLEVAEVVVAVCEKPVLDLFDLTEPLLNKQPLPPMRSLLLPQPKMTAGPRCPTRRVARAVRWHPRMCTYRPVSLRFDD